MASPVDCLIETGAKRTFVAAAGWPGWCRSGRDEAAGLEALWSYRDRYAAVVEGARVRFPVARSLSALRVTERAAGNATTDFGAPDAAFAADGESIDGREWSRLRSVLEACWEAFDRAAIEAEGVELTTGPRGGGRVLGKIVEHVVTSEASYLRRLTGAGTALDERDPWASRETERAAMRTGLDRAQSGDLPERGPRGGAMWAPRRFLRRAAWHVLDHAWEIEDRATA
ncbi:MAG TPA: hypothetical protein VNC60_06830 [Actinomycetota bacterium]|nr:hypothetical protein [Actinomycetota bacterium]